MSSVYTPAIENSEELIENPQFSLYKKNHL